MQLFWVIDLKACKNYTFYRGKKDKSKGFHTLTHNLKTTTDTAMKFCMYIKLSVKYTCSSICSYFESDRVLKPANLHFSQWKKDKSDGFHTLTCNNLKTTTDTAMKLCISVKYTCSSICTYFESVRVLKSAKSSFFTAEKGRVCSRKHGKAVSPLSSMNIQAYMAVMSGVNWHGLQLIFL